MRHADSSTYLFAVPPEVIPLLPGLLPDDQYLRLIEGTLRLSAPAGR
jgi:hypothetical protein